MSRPRTAEPRIEQLNLSLTARELESVRARAAALGMRPVHFGRAVLLEASATPHAHSHREQAPQSNLDRLIYGQLARIGNNLNQMMRQMHRFRDPLPRDLEPLLADIRKMIARVPR